MTDTFPRKPPVDHSPSARSVIDITDGDSRAVFEALRCETARSIIAVIDNPTTASELADQLDTSIQNITYHLSKLWDAGLIEKVGTWYSAKGREMTVYAPTSERLEIPLSDGKDEHAKIHTSEPRQTNKSPSRPALND